MMRTEEEVKEVQEGRKTIKEGAKIQEKSQQAAAKPPPPPETIPDSSKARRTSGKIPEKARDPNKGSRVQMEEVKVVPQNVNPLK